MPGISTAVLPLAAASDGSPEPSLPLALLGLAVTVAFVALAGHYIRQALRLRALVRDADRAIPALAQTLRDGPEEVRLPVALELLFLAEARERAGRKDPYVGVDLTTISQVLGDNGLDTDYLRALNGVRADRRLMIVGICAGLNPTEMRGLKHAEPEMLRGLAALRGHNVDRLLPVPSNPDSDVPK